MPTLFHIMREAEGNLRLTSLAAFRGVRVDNPEGHLRVIVNRGPQRATVDGSTFLIGRMVSVDSWEFIVCCGSLFGSELFPFLNSVGMPVGERECRALCGGSKALYFKVDFFNHSSIGRDLGLAF